MLSVVRNETLFLLKYHLDQVLMVAADLVDIASILGLEIIVSLQRHFSKRSGLLRLRPLSFLGLNLLAPLLEHLILLRGRFDQLISLHRPQRRLSRYEAIVC